ncbi:hypothetical protein SUSAZ_07575 [Sulfolobus acidocaldarius SUSAZ]|nr:hypothetical protein SUSAZ_07575 [Sulfolobus acidocaldarius SUSAZ]
MKKRTIAELLTDIRMAKYKIDMWISKTENRNKALERLSLSNIGRFPLLSKEYIKETELTRKYIVTLVQLKILLEILEIRLETLIILGNVVTYLSPLVEALNELKGQLGASIEFSPIIDEIIETIRTVYIAPNTVQQSPQINVKEEAKQLLKEAEDVAKKELKENYKIEI